MTHRLLARPHDTAPARTLEENRRLQARVAELERERDRLIAVVDILRGTAAAGSVREILHLVARRLGDAYGLDRCSIYLADASQARLMATYEDPTVTDLVVDLNRYPELKRALASNEAVLIADATADPMFRPIRDTLSARNVRSILVAPIRWQGAAVGAIVLRSQHESAPFDEQDVRFCEVIASLTASAVRTAHREHQRRSARHARREAQRAADLQRATLLSFLRRVIDRSAASGDLWFEQLLPAATADALDRIAAEAVGAVSEVSRG